MAVLEIDEAVVSRALFDRAKAGDEAARDEIRKRLHGVELYFHIFADRSMPDGEVFTLRELHEIGVIDSVVINTKPPENRSVQLGDHCLHYVDRPEKKLVIE